MEDLELIQRICSGEREAYSDLVRLYQSRVLRLCTSLLGDANSAEDAAQDVFLKVYRVLPTFRGDASFSTWLYRIAANHCKDLLRKRKREKTESWEGLLEKHGDTIEQMLAVKESPKPSAGDAELVEKVLSQLAPDYRIILTLREAQGLSYQEIADTLQCSLDAVKARLRRAREALQDKLRHIYRSESV